VQPNIPHKLIFNEPCFIVRVTDTISRLPSPRECAECELESEEQGGFHLIGQYSDADARVPAFTGDIVPGADAQTGSSSPDTTERAKQRLIDAANRALANRPNRASQFSPPSLFSRSSWPEPRYQRWHRARGGLGWLMSSRASRTAQMIEAQIATVLA
jgi:hypothetical protein